MEHEINQRIDFVDLVKGICIILVVMSHVGGFFDRLDYHSMITCFRMPLYFFISGIFFKSYSGFGNFTLRKINKLLIPFIFFYLSAWVLMYASYMLVPGLFRLPVRVSELLYIFQDHNLIRFNPPIWFLLALFNCNLLFYLVHYLRDKHLSLFFIVILLIGAIGFYLGKYHISLPLYMDVAMTALPFYSLGFWIRRYNFFLYSHHRFDRFIPVYVLFALLVMYFTASPVGMRTNSYSGYFFLFTAAAFCGIIMIMLLGKWLGHLPMVSYIGRYSIVTLGIHGPILHFLFPIVGKFVHSSLLFSLIVFVILIVICYLLTPIVLKIIPQLVAQKDLIKINCTKSSDKKF